MAPAVGARDASQLNDEEVKAAVKAFEALGLCAQLAEAAAGLGWKAPSVIQQQAIPPLLAGARLFQKDREKKLATARSGGAIPW
jgi:superfamily II DNA/RNA helicase